MKHLTPRDIHPGDYVFVSQYYREDNTPDTLIPVQVDTVSNNYVEVKEGSGVTKYAWIQVYPIILSKKNLELLGWLQISPECHEDYTIFAQGHVTIDAIVDIEDPNRTASVYYNDGDAHDARYVHEVQDIVYHLSDGWCKPEFYTCIWIACHTSKNNVKQALHGLIKEIDNYKAV